MVKRLNNTPEMNEILRLLKDVQCKYSTETNANHLRQFIEDTYKQLFYGSYFIRLEDKALNTSNENPPPPPEYDPIRKTGF